MLTPLNEADRKALADRGNRLREANRKVLEAMHAPLQRELRESIIRQFGVDIEDQEIKSLIDMSNPTWSPKQMREAVYRYCRVTAREANAEGALGALLRAGAQTAVNSMYQAVPLAFEGVVQVVPSNKAIELYNPLLRAGFPSRTGEGDEPRRAKASGLDIQIRNAKEAAIFEVTEEMMEDDLSNQISDQPRQIGENTAIVKDAWQAQRWLGSAGTDPGGDVIPASQTGGMAGETTWPYNTSFTKGAGQNRLTTYLTFGVTGVQQAQQLAFQMLDANGRKMLVSPDTLIGGSALADSIALFLNSEYYPVTGSLKVAVAGGADTGVGTTFATNIFRGRFNPVISRWISNKAWGIMQAGRGLVHQQRRPLRVLQESPVSGPAFSAGVFRFKIDERWEVDWVEPRFSILGNDGTV